MKKLLLVSSVTGAYGFHVVNKPNKENVVLNIDSNLLHDNILNNTSKKRNYCPQLWILSKIANLSIFTNNNSIYGGHELNKLYSDVDILNKYKVCDDKYVIETAATVALIITANDKNVDKFNNMFDLGCKTYFLPIKKDNKDVHKQHLAKLCCALFFNCLRNDVTNVVGKLF